MPRPQLPPVMVADLVASSSATGLGAGASGFTDYSRANPASWADGRSVLIDLYSPKSLPVNGTAKPSVLYAMPVKNQTVALDGAGSLAGDMDLWKSQQGRLVVNVPMQYTGTTYISEGNLELNNTLAGNVELRALGTLSGTGTVNGQLILEGALHYEGGRLMPGTENTVGTLTLKKGLNVDKLLYAEMNLSDADSASDRIRVEGDLKIAEGGSIVFNLKPDVANIKPSRFKLIEYTGAFTGSLDNVSVTGLQGLSTSVVNEEGGLWLVVNEQRAATDGVRWTGAQGEQWDYQTRNFTVGNGDTEFVAGDAISFGDDAVSTTITVDELMPVKNVNFDNESKTLTLAGKGGISGSGKLVKSGAGRVNLDVVNSDYTGATVISGGTVRVKALSDAGLASSIGAASADAANFQLSDATLDIDNQNASTNRGLTLGGEATVNISKGTAAFKGKVVGDGTLIKTGAGQLNLTYDGANDYAATILRGGTIAMGTWRSTFGKPTSPITVEGKNTQITLFDNNSSSAMPVFDNRLTVNEDAVVTLNTGKRLTVRGSFHGKGTVKISFPYVRGDFETDCSDFEGTLDATGATGAQFRLSKTLDMPKGTFNVGKGVYVAHVKAGSANEESRESKIGALKGNASDASFNSGTWNVGYNGLSTSFAGTFAASSTLNKYGDGTLTLKGQSQASMYVYGGAICIDGGNICSSTVFVNDGGMLCGEGSVKNVTVNEGGVLATGSPEDFFGSTEVTGSLTVNKGTLRFVHDGGYCSPLIVDGQAVLNDPVLMMPTVNGDWEAGKEYQLIDCNNITINGTVSFTDNSYVWDTTSLATAGTVRLVSSGISDITADSIDSEAVIYDLQGVRLDRITRPGFYIVNGVKVFVTI